jgi:DNA-binding transcriptional regulator GbsR (MarR family)
MSATTLKLTNVEQLPHQLMVKALNLRNSSRVIYITLCNCKEAKSASDIADLVGESRAYVSMRLHQLEDQDLVKEVKGANHREKLFMVVQ